MKAVIGGRPSPELELEIARLRALVAEIDPEDPEADAKVLAIAATSPITIDRAEWEAFMRFVRHGAV